MKTLLLYILIIITAPFILLGTLAVALSLAAGFMAVIGIPLMTWLGVPQQ